MTDRPTLVLPLAAASLLAAAALASAEPVAEVAQSEAEARHVAAQFEALDRDGDGRATATELPDAMEALVMLSDADGDGALSLTEYSAFHRDPGGAGRTPVPENVRVQEGIAYAGTTNPRQQLDLWLPKQRSGPEPLPVVFYVHGGAWNMGSRVMARPQVAPLVASGDYAAVAVGYRLSWEAPWPAQIHDLKAALRWVRAHAEEYGLDSERICAMGASAGGHLVAELGTTSGVAEVEGALGPHRGEPSDVQCVIDLFGPTDLLAPPLASRARVTGGGPSSIAQLLGAAPADVPDIARQASPLHHVDPADPPFLIFHGTDDPLVAIAESHKLEHALREAGVDAYLVVVEGGGHGDFIGPEVMRRVRLFLDRELRGGSAPVPTDPIVFVPGSRAGVDAEPARRP